MRNVCIGVGSLMALVLFAACSSGQLKARKETREKVAASNHLFCDFINGEAYPDIDVQLNIEMAKRCDSDKSMTITNYRSPSDLIGVLYCCATREDAAEMSMDKEQHKESAKEPKKGH